MQLTQDPVFHGILAGVVGAALSIALVLWLSPTLGLAVPLITTGATLLAMVIGFSISLRSLRRRRR
jgi:cell division protein FtsW (lipid II flippase)